MTPVDRYIPLERRFAELGEAKDSEDLALRSYIGRGMGVSPDIAWPDIFRDGRSCVILGEAGSGKSREMEEQMRRLRGTGVTAAHVDLRDLLIGSALMDGDPMLRSWRRGDGIAWFFLDSVDESKLTHPNDFHRALKQMGAWVGMDNYRARYVISSRISEWRAATDKRLVEETLLPPIRIPSTPGVMKWRKTPHSLNDRATDLKRTESNANEGVESEAELRVLTLLPLTEQQARAYLAGRGWVDERFFGEIEEADAWDFLGRPLDVTNLYALWQKRGRLGALHEVVEHSVIELLVDPKRAAPIPADKLREGAEYVAACFTFGKSVSAILPDAVLPDATDALRFRSCVPQGWADADAALLAQCPIFDAAAYGKLRFHHRSYQAYLTACWIARLMRSDCPDAELRHLLFGQRSNGCLTLRPSLAEVAAWVACLDVGGARWQAMLRDDLLQSAPWVFFAHGDPQSLPVEYKTRVLRRTVEHFKGRDHVRLDWDRPTLKRFADPDLARAVAGVIADPSVGIDLRADYVSLARCGKLIDAIPSVLAVSVDPSANEYLRTTALICIAEIGSVAHRREVLAAFETCYDISVRLGVQLVQVAYPQVADERELFAWLQRMRVTPGPSRPSVLYALDHFVERGIPAERALPFLEQVCVFLRDDVGKPREDHAWTGEWLAPLAVQVLQLPQLDKRALRVALDACTLIEALREQHWLEYGIEDDLRALSDATTRHLAFRREWYWRKVAHYRKTEGKEPHDIWTLDEYYAPLSQRLCDMDWLIEDVRAGPLTDRHFALRSALGMCRTKAGRRALLPPLKLVRASVDSPELRRELVSYARTSVLMPWHVLHRRWKWDWRRPHWWRRRVKPVRSTYWNVRNRVHLWWRRADLQGGCWWEGNWFVIQHARAKRSASQWGSHDLAEPKARYGKAVVEATMVGADRIWRQERPELPHEKRQRNQTPAKTILGLVALQSAWEAQGAAYFHSLTSEEAETATRYALDELNGFPEWFGAVVTAHPRAVGGVLKMALEGEWQATPSESHSSPTLQRLVYGPEHVAQLVALALRQLLQGPPPANTVVVRDALRLALREGRADRTWLAARAAAHLDAATAIGDSEWPWLVCLFLTDADRALSVLERHFETLDAASRDEMAVSLCANLADNFREGLSCPDPDFGRPMFLRRFIPWVHQYVRVADDVVHEGVFSPDARDGAEQFRGSLLGRLEASDDNEADAVLTELANDSHLSDIRDSVLYRIDQRSSARADEYVIEPCDIESLLVRHERVPHSRADLFQIGLSRLAKFKEAVESAEVSIRRQYWSHWRESDYQGWLQGWLQERAHGLYTVPSEAKVDPGKFPDLRFEAAGVDGAVSVEAKVATFDHWSYEKLEERLQNQLVGQYLRARNARNGVYVLFRADAGRRWKDNDGKLLDWPALLSRLQTVADAVLVARPDIDNLVVLGIDVTPPVLPSRV